MITLSLLQQLEDDGFGTIDEDLFFQEVPLDNNGIPRNGMWIVSRGGAVDRHNINIQPFDIYSRHSNKLTGAQQLQDVLQKLQEYYSNCTLPAVEPYNEGYNNVTITPTTSLEAVSSDAQDKMVYVISGELHW